MDSIWSIYYKKHLFESIVGFTKLKLGQNLNIDMLYNSQMIKNNRKQVIVLQSYSTLIDINLT
jgi:hypothetical protein